MLDELVSAIERRVLIEFMYDGQPRLVQPGAVGTHIDTGNLILRGYQIGGNSNSRTPPLWDMFLVQKIDGLRLSDDVFSDNPPLYSRDDKHMDRIHAQL